MIQKVPCNQVVVQANAKSNVRLDELNNILNEMATGQEAVQRLAELDAKVTGWTPAQQTEQNAKNAAKKQAKQNEGREVGVPPNAAKPVELPIVTESALSDTDIAQNLLDQAERMKQQAASMLAEVTRLTNQAIALTPASAVKVRKTNGTKTKVKAN
jgi:hypothetical protein